MSMTGGNSECTEVIFHTNNEAKLEEAGGLVRSGFVSCLPLVKSVDS